MFAQGKSMVNYAKLLKSHHWLINCMQIIWLEWKFRNLSQAVWAQLNFEWFTDCIMIVIIWHRMGVSVFVCVSVCVWDCVPMWLSPAKHLIAQLIEVASSTTAIHSAAGVISVNVTGNNVALSLPTSLSLTLSLSFSACLSVRYFPLSVYLCRSQSSHRRRRQCLGNGNILSIIHQQPEVDASKSRLDCTL